MKQGTPKRVAPVKVYPTVEKMTGGEWFIVDDEATNAVPYMKLVEPAYDEDDGTTAYWAVSWHGNLALPSTDIRAFPITFAGVDDNGNVTYTVDEV